MWRILFIVQVSVYQGAEWFEPCRTGARSLFSLPKTVYITGNIWQMNLKTCFSLVFPEEVKKPEGEIKVVCWIRNSWKHCDQEESRKLQPLMQKGLSFRCKAGPHMQVVSRCLSRWGGEEEQEARTGLFRLFPLLDLPLVCVLVPISFLGISLRSSIILGASFPSAPLIAKYKCSFSWIWILLSLSTDTLLFHAFAHTLQTYWRSLHRHRCLMFSSTSSLNSLQA